MGEKKDTTIRVHKSDVRLAHKVKRELGVSSMKELFHQFVLRYYFPLPSDLEVISIE